MLPVINRMLAAACVAASILFVWLTGARADVVALRGGREFGGADARAYYGDEKLVIVDASGPSQIVPLKDVVLMKLDGPRKLKLTNQDVLHVENVTVEEGRMSFTSRLLGQNAVPLEAVVGISQPAGAEIPEAPVELKHTPEAPPKKWQGKVQFSYMGTSGREDTQNVNLGAEAIRETDKTRLTLNAAARYGETSGEDTADAQEVSAKYDIFLTDRLFWYWDLGALRDKINLIDLRLSPGVGLGRKFITGDRFSLEGEAGVTMIWEKLAVASDEDDKDSEWFGRLAARLRWKIADGTEFSEELEVLPGLSSSDEFRYRSVSQLTTAVTKKLSLAAAFTIDYDNDPPGDVPHTSTNASTGFIYSF